VLSLYVKVETKHRMVVFMLRHCTAINIVRGETQLSVIVLVWCSYVGIKQKKDQFCLCGMVCVVIFVQDRNKTKSGCVHDVVLCCHCWLGEKPN
jgi:hypothetical protein